MSTTVVALFWWGVGFWCGVFVAWAMTRKAKREDVGGYQPRRILREGLTKTGTKTWSNKPRPMNSPPTQGNPQRGNR